MNIIISNKLFIDGIDQELINKLKNAFTMENPKWKENDKHGRSNWSTPRQLRFYSETDSGKLVLPRGYIDNLKSYAEKNNIKINEDDRRIFLDGTYFKFKGELRPFQKEAVNNLLKSDQGVLSSPTGSGKTVTALYMIQKRSQPTLVIVHTKELLYQWIERSLQFLNVSRDEIGVIGDGKRLLGEKLTISLIQSLINYTDQIESEIGHVIVDEGHRVPSKVFSTAVSSMRPKYLLGLSTTPWRHDGLTKLIYWYMGNLQHKVDPQKLIDKGEILPLKIVIRHTGCTLPYPEDVYTKIISKLVKNKERNLFIIRDIASETRNGICLVLSDRKIHLKTMQNMMGSKFPQIKTKLLIGTTSTMERQETIDQANKNEINVLFATSKLIGEGFDCKNLTILFLTVPISAPGRVIQYAGRVTRKAHPGKTPKLYDYVDNIDILYGSAKSRQRVYKNL